MSFSEAIRSVFSHYADFGGRARRSEYWYFTLMNIFISMVITVLQRSLGVKSGLYTLISGLYGIYTLGVLIPGLAVSCRRLHDIGKSGWFLLINLIPLVGQIILIVWLCQDSSPGSNQYGEYPKAKNFFGE